MRSVGQSVGPDYLLAFGVILDVVLTTLGMYVVYLGQWRRRTFREWMWSPGVLTRLCDERRRFGIRANPRSTSTAIISTARLHIAMSYFYGSYSYSAGYDSDDDFNREWGLGAYASDGGNSSLGYRDRYQDDYQFDYGPAYAESGTWSDTSGASVLESSADQASTLAVLCAPDDISPGESLRRHEILCDPTSADWNGPRRRGGERCPWASF